MQTGKLQSGFEKLRHLGMLEWSIEAVILKFHDKADSLLVSGLLAGGDELTGKAAVVDAPVGKGHVVLFGIRPLWRWESQGSFAFVLNAIANWNHLDSLHWRQWRAKSPSWPRM